MSLDHGEVTPFPALPVHEIIQISHTTLDAILVRLNLSLTEGNRFLLIFLCLVFQHHLEQLLKLGTGLLLGILILGVLGSRGEEEVAVVLRSFG